MIDGIPNRVYLYQKDMIDRCIMPTTAILMGKKDGETHGKPQDLSLIFALVDLVPGRTLAALSHWRSADAWVGTSHQSLLSVGFEWSN